MSVTFNPISLDDLTTAQVNGTGVFDVLMKASREHLEQEFRQGRLKGNEYAQVYLASTQSVLSTALQFVLSREAQNLDFQIKAKEVELQGQRLALLEQEVATATARLANIAKEGALLEAQAGKTQADTQVASQQRLNLIDELLTTAKQRDRLAQEIANLASEKSRVEAQTSQITAETANVAKQGLVLDKQALEITSRTALVDQQKTNLTAEALNIPKAGAKLDSDTALVTQQRLNLISEELGIDARTELVTQQKANAVIEGTVLTAQECKLRAEYDLILNSKAKGEAEILLLNQKKLTEAAQISAASVDTDSVIGRQKALYSAQAAGFNRDAEQKAADLLIRSWVARKTSDPDGTVADGTNQLGDSAIGRAVNKLLSGVGA